MGIKNSIKKKAATLAFIKLLSGGLDAQAAQAPDTEVPTNPKAITDTYDGYHDTILTFEDSMRMLGYALQVDVSSNNGKIDWKKLNGEIHPVLAMIRSHSVVGSSFEEDTMLEENIKGCAEIGLPVGVYFIARLTQNEEEVRRETSILIQRLNELETKYNTKITNVAIDYEEPSHTAYPEICVKNIQIMKEMLKEHNYDLVIYTTSSCKNELDNAAKNAGIDNFEETDSWIASYSNENSYNASSTTQSVDDAINNANTPSYENVAVHQFTDNADASKFQNTGNYGIDISFIHDENFIQSEEKTEEKNSNLNNSKEQVKMETVSHIVKSGETVSDICAEYGITIEEFKYYNPQINDINLIQEKQLVEIPKEQVEKLINQSESQNKEDNITRDDDTQQPGNIKGAIYLFGGSATLSYVINGIVERKKRTSKVKNSFEHSDNYNRMNGFVEIKRAR